MAGGITQNTRPDITDDILDLSYIHDLACTACKSTATTLKDITENEILRYVEDTYMTNLCKLVFFIIGFDP